MKTAYAKPILIAGVLFAAGTTVWGYRTLEKKSRTRLMQALYEELTKLFNPLDQGLDAEEAFNIHLLDSLQQQGLYPNYSMDSFYRRKAEELHDAFGRWGYNDDEAKINAILTRLQDKVAVSQVAKQYQQHYDIRLRDKLRRALDPKEVSQLLANIRRMKTYTPS